MARLDHQAQSGLPYALAAHAVWGSMPIYLLLVRDVPALEYVAWRIVFTMPLCVAILAWRGNLTEIRAVARDPRTMLALLGSSATIGINWFLYVWAIQSGYIYAASLGYYILPLVMMLLALVVLGERLTRRQWGAVCLAGAGVAALSAGALTTLWLSLSMGVSFAIYGLLRKTVAAGPLAGLTLETLILLPVAIAVIAWFAATPGGTVLGRDGWETFGIVWGGPMTAIPLLMFATAARRMPYSVIGFLQFISPTIVFLLGLFLFGEELQPAQLACFIALWAGVALFVWDMLRGNRVPATDAEALRGGS